MALNRADDLTLAQPPSPDRDVTLPPEPVRPAAVPPARLPGYDVLGELGRGGMGVVYQARQVSADRVVAVKMLLAGSDGVDRFRTEAEAIARLSHPNIVQVFEVGESDGRPFFSLEFCPGGSLDRRLAGTPLSPAEAARLAEALAAAMAAAHDRGVVHRDLKPANVLLTADGTPKLTDFGLAKLLDDADSVTRTGSIMGTPSYMAPEQAEGRKDVGPPADVYALGAILYECLTGRPPFKAATPLETIRQVVNDDPVPPRRLDAKVPADLETICLKALRKDPARRYPSAHALADDVRRFRAGEPILARPTPWWERAVKWGRRRPAAAALLAVSVLAAAALAAVMLAYQARLRQGNAELRDALERADDEHRRAQGHLNTALEAVDRMLTRVGDERLAGVPEFAGMRRELLEEALDFYRGFLRRESDDPAVRRETGRAYGRIARLHFGLGRVAEAEKACDEARALQERLLADFPDEPDYRHDLAGTHAYLGHIYATTGRFAPSAAAYGEALKLDAALLAAYPDRADFAEGVVAGHGNLGHFNSVGDPREAERHLRAAVTVSERLAGARPESVAYQGLVAAWRTELGVQLVRSGKLPEAEKLLETGLPSADAPSVGGPRDAAAVRAKNAVWRGNLYSRTKRAAKAETSLREGVAAYEALVKTGNAHFAHQNELTAAYRALAELLEEAGRADAAEAWGKGIDSAARLTRDFPAFAWLAAGEDRMRVRALARPAGLGRFAEVIPKADALAAKGSLPPDVCYDLACVYALARSDEKAIKLLRRAAAMGHFQRPAAREHARKDEDLKALHGREDFRAILDGAK